MIIDNNFKGNNFENKFKRYNENAQNKSNNIFVKNIKEQKYSNPLNNNDMYDKSLAMLQERLSKGLISLEEFNKKCAALGNRRRK